MQTATATARPIVVPTFADRRVLRGQRSGTPMAVNLGFLDRSRYYFYHVIPQLSSWGWVDPVPDPLLLRKSGSAGNRTRGLWVCNQELWPQDHRGALSGILLCKVGARGSVVVKVLCYKLEGRVRDPMRWMIFIKLPNPSGLTRPWGLLSL
jgi:hypothetical protein